MTTANSSLNSGFVSLVGAGPGDPDLLTVKGLKAIQAAEVVVYDRLVSKEILELAHVSAEMIYVGKSSIFTAYHKTRSIKSWCRKRKKVNALCA